LFWQIRAALPVAARPIATFVFQQSSKAVLDFAFVSPTAIR
jgi:hypothetical protein